MSDDESWPTIPGDKGQPVAVPSLPRRKYADEAAKHAHEYPPHIAELQRSVAELKDALLVGWPGRFAYRCCDLIVRADSAWQRRKNRSRPPE
jgi:hypothetical protein